MFEMDVKNIALILFGIIILYLLYKTRKIQSETGEIEGFAATNDEMRAAIKEIYNADIDAIRNLSNIATELTKKNDTLTIPVNKFKIIGDLEIDGNVNFVKRDNMLMNIIPSGFILAHYAGYDPKGWATCDGQSYILGPNGDAVAVLSTTQGAILTPDLRSRFIIGSSGTAENQTITNNVGVKLTSRPYGGWGGEENVALTETQNGPHFHHTFVLGSNTSISWGRYLKPETSPITLLNSGDNNGNYVMQSTGGGDVPTVGKTSPGGTGQPHNNIPPYFSLKYYMKL